MPLLIDGPTALAGSIPVSGAKNAALPCMFATLLADGTTTLSNVPDVADIDTAARALAGLGMEAVRDGGRLEVSPGPSPGCDLPPDLARSMRASILALGPLLARRGEATVPLPGGCDFGERPIDIHIRGLERMGARIELRDGVLHAAADGLAGAELDLAFPTFTGTENLIMAATLAKGTTVIRNAGREPEISDLARMLRAMGADVGGDGTSTVTVTGVESLSGCEHRVMPDRIEACTYLAATVAAGGEVQLTGTGENVSQAVFDLLAGSGASISDSGESVTVSMAERPRPMSFATEPYPGLPTDVQAQLMAVNCVASGTATITEGVWEKRFNTAVELAKLGAKVEVAGNTATVTGVERLRGGDVFATDLRASAALVIAGLCAEGRTAVHGVEHLRRGYEDLPGKLGRLGARVSVGAGAGEGGSGQVQPGQGGQGG